jgi:LPXTG-motif cell wall-anchored protein
VYIEVEEGQGDFTRDVREYENNLRVYFEHIDGDLNTNDLIEVPMQAIDNSGLDTTQDQIKYSEDGFKLCLDMMTRQNLVGNKIYVVYDAVINGEAVVRISENKAVLEYGHDDDITVKDDSTKVYTSRILIDKFEAGSTANSQKLSGAEFILRRAVYTIPTEPNEAPVFDHYEYYTWAEKYVPEDPTSSDINEILVWEGVVWSSKDNIITELYNSHPEFVTYTNYYENMDEEELLKLAADEGIITKVVTDDNGAALFDGLADYTNYEVIEIKAPAGYTKLAAPIPVVINGEDATTVGLSAIQVTEILTEVLNVANTPGSLIPSTGGMGTTLFYIVGAIMVFGAVVVLVTRRRMSE